jgi:ABC-type branched-subunit amino acid transport system substrate-binding protein
MATREGVTMLIDRRAFLRLTSVWGLVGGLGAGGLSPAAQAAVQPPSVVRIAHVSRRQGPAADMASYAIMGAQLGVEEANITAGMFEATVELIIEDGVSAENVAALTGKLGAQRGLTAMIGALDDRTTALLSDLTQRQPVVFLNAAARSLELRGAHCHRHTFHIEPDVAMYTDAIGQWLVRNNRQRWHFVVSEEALAEEVYRRASRFLQGHGGSELGRSVIAPGQRDVAPVLSQLPRDAQDTVVVALQGEALQRFLRQYRAAGMTALVAGAPLDTIAMWHTDPQDVQGVWATSWYHELERYSGRELNARFVRRFGQPAEAYAWASWAAVKLIVEGVLRSASVEAAALVQHLESAPPFDGHKGKALTFRDWNHQLRQPLFIVKAREAKAERARDLFELAAEMPPPAARGKSALELLDTLGESRADSSCRLEPL